MSAIERILKTAKEKGYNQVSLAEHLKEYGVKKQTITDWKKGRSNTYSLLILEISNLLNVSKDYLLGNTDEPEQSLEEMKRRGMDVRVIEKDWVKIPIYGTIKASYNGIAYEDFEGYESLEKSSIKGDISEYFFLRVRGDSMEPEIYSGDLVLIKKQPDIDNNGQVAAVYYGNEESTLKKVYKSSKYIELRAINKAYEPKIITGTELENVTICGVMKRLLRIY